MKFKVGDKVIITNIGENGTIEKIDLERNEKPVYYLKTLSKEFKNLPFFEEDLTVCKNKKNAPIVREPLKGLSRCQFEDLLPYLEEKKEDMFLSNKFTEMCEEVCRKVEITLTSLNTVRKIIIRSTPNSLKRKEKLKGVDKEFNKFNKIYNYLCKRRVRK